MKKKICFALLVAIVTSLLFNAAACYQKEGGTVKDIAGTYKLERKTVGYDSSGSAIDVIDENQIVEYIVVAEDGFGFHVYGDKNTPLSCRQIKIKFIPSEEDPSLYEYIEFNHYFGDSMTKLAYFKPEKKLNFGNPALKSGCVNVEASSVSYKNISDDCTLSTVQNELNTTFTYKSYALYHYYSWDFFMHDLYLDRMQTDDVSESLWIDSKYIYRIFDIDYDNNKADVYYCLRSDEEPKVERDLAFSYKTLPSENENEYDYLEFTIGTEVFRAEYSGLIYKTYEQDGVLCRESYFSRNLSEGETIESYANAFLKSYLAAKTEE